MSLTFIQYFYLVDIVADLVKCNRRKPLLQGKKKKNKNKKRAQVYFLGVPNFELQPDLLSEKKKL